MSSLESFSGGSADSANDHKDCYTCKMHAEVRTENFDLCPNCGAQLVLKESLSINEAANRMFRELETGKQKEQLKRKESEEAERLVTEKVDKSNNDLREIFGKARDLANAVIALEKRISEFESKKQGFGVFGEVFGGNKEAKALESEIDNLKEKIAIELPKLSQEVATVALEMETFAQLSNKAPAHLIANLNATKDLLNTLGKRGEVLKVTEIEKANIWDGSGALFLNQIGKAGKFITDKVIARGLGSASQFVKEKTKAIPLVNNLVETAAVMLLDLPSGVSQGIGELAQGLASFVAHPLDTLDGMTALLGRDPRSGKWAVATASSAWAQLSKNVDAATDLRNESYGKALGRVGLSMLGKISGFAAVKRGALAVGAVYKVSKTAGSGSGEAVLRAVSTFAPEFLAGLGEIPKDLLAGPGRLAKFSLEASHGLGFDKEDQEKRMKINLGNEAAEISGEFMGHKIAGERFEDLKVLHGKTAEQLANLSSEELRTLDIKTGRDVRDLLEHRKLVEKHEAIHGNLHRLKDSQELSQEPVTSNVENVGAEIEKITVQIGELQRKKSAIEQTALSGLFADLEKYIKENSDLNALVTSFDENLAIKETIHQIRINEDRLLEINTEIEKLTKEAGLLLSNTEKGLIQNSENSEFNNLIAAEKHSEALKLLARQNQELNDINGNLSAYDLSVLYERAKNDPQWRYGQFEPESYGAQMLPQGYIAFNNAKTKRALKLGRSATYYLARREQDGSMKYIQVRDTGEKFVQKDFDSRSLDDQNQAKIKVEALRPNMMLAISKNPSFQKIQAAGSELQSKFVPMQRVLMVGLEGGKTAEVVEHVRGYAWEISKFDFYALRRNLDAARADLQLLKSFSAGVTDEFEVQIKQMEKAFSQITELVQGQRIENFCNFILDPGEFNEDNFKNWFIKEGIVIISSIVIATAAVVLLVGSGGTATPVSLALLAQSAAIGTAAGIVGAEIGHVASQEVGRAVYGEDYNNKSALGKYASYEGTYGIHTGEYKYFSGREIASKYTQEFVLGFAQTFILMGMGKAAGNFLNKFAAAHLEAGGLKELSAKLITKIPKLNPQKVGEFERKGFMPALKRIAGEVLEEHLEEGVEAAAGEIDRRFETKFSFFVSVYNSLDGSNVQKDFNKHGVLALQSSVINNPGQTTILSNFNFDPLKAQALEVDLRSTYGGSHKIETQADGSIRASQEVVGHSGEKFTNVLNFVPNSSKASAEIIQDPKLIPIEEAHIKALGIFEAGKIKAPKTLVPEILSSLNTDGQSPEQKLKTLNEVLAKVRKELTPKAFDRYFTPELMSFLQGLENDHQALTKESEKLLAHLNSSEGFKHLESQMLEKIGKALDKNYHLPKEEYAAMEKAYKAYGEVAAQYRLNGGYLLAKFAADSRSVKDNSVLREHQLRSQEVECYRELGREVLDRARLESDGKIARMPYEQTSSIAGEKIVVKRNPERKQFSEIENRTPVFVIGDTHGSYEAFEKSLETAGIIKIDENKNIEWVGGDTKVVLLGDIFDRGKDGLKILDLMKRLDGKGRFVVNVGNHETILLQAGFGTISEPTFHGWLYKQGGLDTLKGLAQNNPEYEKLVDEVADLQKELEIEEKKGQDKSLTAEQKSEHQKQWKKRLKDLKEKYGKSVELLVRNEVIGLKPGEKYGDLIANFKVVEQIDDTLYVHSEISPQLLYLVAGGGVDRVNDLWRRAFLKAAYETQKVREDGSTVTIGPKSKYLDKLILSPYNDAFWSRLLSEKKIPSAFGRKQASEGHIENVADLLKRAGINNVVIGHTPSNLFSKVGKNEEGKKYFEGAEDNKQFAAHVGELNVIFNDIALSPGVSKEEGPRVGGVRITPELGKRGEVQFINPTGTYQQNVDAKDDIEAVD